MSKKTYCVALGDLLKQIVALPVTDNLVQLVYQQQVYAEQTLMACPLKVLIYPGLSFDRR